ncbi:MAG: carboxypeptidase-like regulatory domain-containing protein [Planctomycetaceae bacterium]|nr:carboxypeptidase-like regulatory domain-containing protein [Planctomycetaceae bacterium]
MLRKILTTLVFVTVILYLSSCGGTKKPDGLPDLYPCRIVVTVNEAPLEGALVSLSGNDGRWPGNGFTDQQGIAVIRTRGQFVGVAEGTYKVTVSKVLPPPPTGKDEGSTKEPKQLINSKYTTPETTPLECVVKSGTNNFEFKVEVP